MDQFRFFPLLVGQVFSEAAWLFGWAATLTLGQSGAGHSLAVTVRVAVGRFSHGSAIGEHPALLRVTGSHDGQDRHGSAAAGGRTHRDRDHRGPGPSAGKCADLSFLTRSSSFHVRRFRVQFLVVSDKLERHHDINYVINLTGLRPQASPLVHVGLG